MSSSFSRWTPRLAALVLLGSVVPGALAGVSIGVNIAAPAPAPAPPPPPPPAPAVVYADPNVQPPPPATAEVAYASPGPGTTWIDGHWEREGSRWVWWRGYWEYPPYPGGVWVVGGW